MRPPHARRVHPSDERLYGPSSAVQRLRCGPLARVLGQALPHRLEYARVACQMRRRGELLCQSRRLEKLAAVTVDEAPVVEVLAEREGIERGSEGIDIARPRQNLRVARHVVGLGVRIA